MNTVSQDYVSDLYNAADFNSAFSIYQDEVVRQGFDGVLYTYIPKIILNLYFDVGPVYKVSVDFNKDYLAHYSQARFDRFDPMLKAVEEGITSPLDWWSKQSEAYTDRCPRSRSVLEETRQYGIKNGLTIPLQSGKRSVSGVSVISYEGSGFKRLVENRLSTLCLTTRLFHTFVMSDVSFLTSFSQPLMDKLTENQRRYLRYLAEGKTADEIAFLLNASQSYLEHLMLEIRKKLSGDGLARQAIVNRNQVLYYAGMLNLLE